MDTKRLIARGISRNVLLLSLVSFANDASSEIIMPILPLFIVSLGGDELIIGLVSGIMESVSSLLKVVFGFVSDKLGKRKFLVLSGYSTSALFKLLLSLSTAWHHVVAFTALERVGKGIRTAPRDAIISESMPEERGKGFGIHRAFDTSGAVLGAILAFIFISIMGLAYNTAILIAAVLAFVSLVPFIWIRDVKGGENRKLEFIKGLKGTSRSLKIFLAIATIFSLANISFMFFLRRAQVIYSDDSMVLLLYIIFNISYAIFAYPFGILSDKIGRGRVLTTGYILFSLVCAGFVFSIQTQYITPLFALYGVVYAIIDGNQRAFVSDLSTEELRATSLGAFHTLIGLTALPAGVISGLLWTTISYQATFIYASLLSLIAGVMLTAYFARERNI